jgi:hypothetical protein
MRTILLTLCLCASVVLGTASLQGASVSLAWDTPADGHLVASYRVYSGTNSRAYGRWVGTTNCTVTLTNVVKPSFFAVTAVNGFGLESDFSAELRWPALPVARTNVVLIAERSSNLVVWVEERRFTNAVSGSNCVWRLRIQ